VAQVSAISFSKNTGDETRPIRYTMVEDGPSQNLANGAGVKSEIFRMDEITGVVHLAKKLDYENALTPKSYKLIGWQNLLLDVSANLWTGFLIVAALESDLKETVPLEIELLDVNDNDPIFTQPLYIAFTKEDHPIGQKILQGKIN